MLGDSNLEKSYGHLPTQYAEAIGLQKCSNTEFTTNKQRSNLQGQCGKNKLSQEEKDFIAAPKELTNTETTLYPKVCNDLLPSPEHPTDHRGLVAKFVIP